MDKNVVEMSEVRRLQKAAREGDKNHLREWLFQFDSQIRREYENDMRNRMLQLNKDLKQQYEDAFQKELNEAIENYLVAIVYSLKFSELTRFGPKRIKEFMSDLASTIDMFKNKEYTPEEYKEILAKNGIDLFIKLDGGETENESN